MAPRISLGPQLPSHDAAPPNAAALVTFLFFLSGAAGLIYQIVWTRDLVLVFGNTSQSVSTIVAAFMAGLGFGGLAGGLAARRTLRPLRTYAFVELGIALLALLLPLAFDGIAGAYRSGYETLSPAELALVRFGLSFLAVAPVTFLMGATLPLLTAHFVHDLRQAGPTLGRLYAVNTLGATVGTVIAGFVLIELLGLSQTAHLAVLLNLTAGLGALLLSRFAIAGAAQVRTQQAGVLPVARTEPTGSRSPSRLLLFTATFVSGFVALALEVLWTRDPAEGSGSRIYLFVGILAH